MAPAIKPLVALALLAALASPASAWRCWRCDRFLAEDGAPSPMPAPSDTKMATAAAAAPSTIKAAPKADGPAPMAAPSAIQPAAKASLSSAAIVGGAANFSNGVLTIRGIAPAIVITGADGATSLARTGDVIPKINAASTVLFNGMGADGQAVSALLELADPVLTGDVLTAKAKLVEPAMVQAAAGSPLAAAAAAPDTLLPAGTTAFTSAQASIIIDGVQMASGAGDKGWLGAVIGAGVGGAICGWGCGVGGAAIGGWVG